MSLTLKSEMVISGTRGFRSSPLSSNKPANRGLRYWFGINGAISGREHSRRANRPNYAGRYPMEQVKRIKRPTTLILDEEVSRVPVRANFFVRAKHGDLGKNAQKEKLGLLISLPIHAR